MTEEQEIYLLRFARDNLSFERPRLSAPVPHMVSERYRHTSEDSWDRPVINKAELELRNGEYGTEPYCVQCDAIFVDGEMIWTAIDGYIPQEYRKALKGGDE